MDRNLNSSKNDTNIPKMTTYFFGKIGEAVYILATHSGNIKRRLMVAGVKMLLIPPDEVPEDVRNDIKWIRKQLTRLAPIEEENSLARMRWTLHMSKYPSCVKIAQKILNIYGKLQDYVEREDLKRKD